MKTLHDFMIDQLNELYSAELQMRMFAEKMAFKTSNEKLRHMFEVYAKKAEQQMNSLEKVLSLIGTGPENERYSFIAEGLGNEIEYFLKKDPESEVLDAGFLALMQKGAHYKIALYGTLREFANELRNEEAERLLTGLLDAEKNVDRDLTERARSGVNQRAANPDSLDSTFAATGK